MSCLSFESDDGGAAVDAVGNVLPGELVGAATYVTNDTPLPKAQGAVDLNSGGYITAGIQPELAVQETGLTLTAWFKPQANDFAMGIMEMGSVALVAPAIRCYYVGFPGIEQLVFDTQRRQRYGPGGDTCSYRQPLRGVASRGGDGGSRRATSSCISTVSRKTQTALTESVMWDMTAINDGFTIGAQWRRLRLLHRLD